MSFAAACLLGGGLVACAPSPTPPPLTGEAKGNVVLLDGGGSGGDATGAFEVKGREVYIDYRLDRAPSGSEVSFALERSIGEDRFERVANVTDPVADGLVGTKRIPLLPGRYRIRVETLVPWSAKIYEKTP